MSDKLKISTMIGKRYECACCARIATIIEEYDDGPGDNGYIYEFEGEPGHRWISTVGALMRFRLIGDDTAKVRKALQASVEE